jgi:hypothetical protein
MNKELTIWEYNEKAKCMIVVDIIVLGELE